MAELATAIAAVRLHAEAALLRRLNAGAGFADPRIASQIYLRDDAALARLAGGTLRPQGTHRKPAEELARTIASAPATEDPRLALLATRLGLDPVASGVLLVAAAYALDLDTRELCHALAPRRRPALYLETCADILEADPAALVRALAPGSPLRRGRALTVDGDQLAASLEVAGPTLAWLLGDDALQPPLATICELIPPDAALGVVLPVAACTALDALIPRLHRNPGPDRPAIAPAPVRESDALAPDRAPHRNPGPEPAADRAPIRNPGPDRPAIASAPVRESDAPAADRAPIRNPGPDPAAIAPAAVRESDALAPDRGPIRNPGPDPAADRAPIRNPGPEPADRGPIRNPGPEPAADRALIRNPGPDRPVVAVIISGPRGSGRRAAAHRIAAALGRPLLVVPVPGLLALEQRLRAPMLGAALAAARLRDAVVYLADADALYDDRGQLAPEHADAIAHVPGVVVCGTAGRGGHLELRRPQLAVALPRTELGDRERAWEAALGPHGLGGDAGELAGRYVIGPGAIADVVAEALRYAEAAGTPVDRGALEASVGRRLSLRLGTYGTVVQRKARFGELVLPDDVIDTLHDVIAMVRERSQILERWGYQRHLGISRGVSALFSGEPGTGKTMAASVVASALGLELVRIDLSAVVSKYVGETEKNLAKIFDEAQDAHAMLLFDEADSLFGKRTELKTAQDRFANLEVNYILQRMESFDGVSVLTTNAESSIDPALQRRLNFRIRFPEPEVEEREKLWKQLLPPDAQLHGGVDFRALAERFDMTGGYIKNAVVRAAVIAARAGRAIAAEDLWTGAHHEYVEMGKVMPWGTE